MTIAEFTTLITTKWGDITSPKRLPTLDRDVANGIKGELYSDAVTDSQATETYTTKGGTDIAYSITIKKTGNNCFIKIAYRNTTSSTLPALESVFTWKDTAFKPKVSVNDFPLVGYRGSNFQNNVSISNKLFLGSGGVSLSEALLPSSQLYYTEYSFYIAQD